MHYTKITETIFYNEKQNYPLFIQILDLTKC